MWRTALILCLCTICLAEETHSSDALQMSAGQDALRRYNLAFIAARETFYRSMIDADQKKLTDLDRAMKIAMNTSNLDEANRVKKVKDAAADTLKEHKIALDDISASRDSARAEAPQNFSVFARERWKTTITVKRGQRYRVTAHGQWCGGPDANKNRIICGPEGITMPDGDHQGDQVWFLEGRINHKYPFAIGASSEFVAQEDGPLEMQMMDWWIYDNDGSIEVQVQHIPVAGL
jgi:hypothetical protein